MARLRTANSRQRRAHERLRAAQTSARERLPIEVVGTAAIPGGGRMHLLRCGGEFSIQVGEDELMGSQDHVSEEALATLAFERLSGESPAVLIGGLGMGFTLRAVLSACSATARITVAELVPEVIEWARGPLAHIFGDCLSDPRVEIALADVHDVIDRASDAFDAILLDVDNGPDGFMRRENDRLYCNWGIRATRAALRPGGVLAIWSAYPDADFRDRLAAAELQVEEITTPAYAGSPDKVHTIWCATRPRGERPRLDEQAMAAVR